MVKKHKKTIKKMPAGKHFNQEGGRVGHNSKHRGKKGYFPILCFIEQTREYLYGKLRKGEIVSGAETAKVIRIIKDHLPSCVKKVLLRADAEFMSWNSVEAALDEGYDFIFSNKQCEPLFDPKSQPQQELFEKDPYTYRIFCTNLSGKVHEAIERYDKRADAENLIGEAKQEGLVLMIGAKLVKSGNCDRVKYSIHDTRTPAVLLFYEFMDHLLFKKHQECKA